MHFPNKVSCKFQGVGLQPITTPQFDPFFELQQHHRPRTSSAILMAKQYEDLPLNDSPRFSIDDESDDEDENAIRLQELSSLLRPKAPPQPLDAEQLLSDLEKMGIVPNDRQQNTSAQNMQQPRYPHLQREVIREPIHRRRRRGHPFRRPYMPMAGGEGRSRCYFYYKLGVLFFIAFTVLYAILSEPVRTKSPWPEWNQVQNIFILYTR
jgi:hypothetical protein